MARVREYNEGDAFVATFGFFDRDFNPASPLTARYRIDCLTTRRTVRDWTDISSPTQTVEITVESDDNIIQNLRNPKEKKQMVVQTNADTTTQKSETTEWWVKNIQGVS